MSTKRFLSLCSILGAITLFSCGSVSSSSQKSNSSESASSTKEETRLPDIVLVDKVNPERLDEDGNVPFSLEEFTDASFKVIYVNGVAKLLYYGEKLISDNLYNSSNIIASDINEDGYRELVFNRNGIDGEPGDRFVVYDVKNGKIMMDEKTDAAVGHYDRCRFNYSLIEGRLTFYPYLGNFSEASIIDYASLKYSKEKGAYFEWKNIFAIKSIRLAQISLASRKGESIGVLEPIKENNRDVYQFELGKYYLMEYQVDRENYDRYFGPGFISLYWNNDNPSHFDRFEPSDKMSSPETGAYVIFFSLHDECEGATWNFYFGEHGFEIPYRIVA